MKTKGAVLWEPNTPWSVEEIEIGDPRGGEVQIKVMAAGLCHSDHHLTTGDTIPASYPVLGGHEGAGIITKVGPGVTDLAVGDHVAMSFVPACGSCRSCLSGLQNLCDLGMHAVDGQSISDGTARVRVQGKDTVQMCSLGTFAPYVTVHQFSTVKIDKHIPFDVAALVSCGVATGWGSATAVADVRPGETVVVVGVGGVGINAVQGAASAGASNVIAIDPFAFRRDQAMKFGATHTFTSMADAAGTIANLTHGHMADKVILTMGRVEGEDIEPALNLTGKGGKCVVVGMTSMESYDVKLGLTMFALMQKSLCGAIFGGSSPKLAIPSLLSMYEKGTLNVKGLITKEYTLEQINEGYQDMLEGRNIRGIIRFSEADW